MFLSFTFHFPFHVLYSNLQLQYKIETSVFYQQIFKKLQLPQQNNKSGFIHIHKTKEASCFHFLYNLGFLFMYNKRSPFLSLWPLTNI